MYFFIRFGRLQVNLQHWLSGHVSVFTGFQIQYKLHTSAEQEMEVVRGSPPSPIIFEGQSLLHQTIHLWKGNLSKSPIHFRYRQNILIWRTYEQFSRNDSAKARQWLQKKISNFKNMNILYIILKHVTWRFR